MHIIFIGWYTEANARLYDRTVCGFLMFNAGITTCHGVELMVKLGKIGQSGDRDRRLEPVALGDERIDAVAAEALPMSPTRNGSAIHSAARRSIAGITPMPRSR